MIFCRGVLNSDLPKGAQYGVNRSEMYKIIDWNSLLLQPGPTAPFPALLCSHEVHLRSVESMPDLPLSTDAYSR